MSAILSHTKVRQMLKEINFPIFIKAKMKEKEKPFEKLSVQVGRAPSYLGKMLKQPDQPVSLLLLLSMHLQTNLFEPFINLLPEDVRITKKEKELQAQIQALQQQITTLTEQRDIYKSIVMK